jgi:hypothetical protein
LVNLVETGNKQHLQTAMIAETHNGTSCRWHPAERQRHEMPVNFVEASAAFHAGGVKRCICSVSL